MNHEHNEVEHMRFNVVGTSGCGKSTFARQIAQINGLPYIEIDRLFWKPGWVGSSDEELETKLRAALRADGWVLDGNYQRTTPIKWAEPLCVIWLDYSFTRVIVQALRRALNRAWSGTELWSGTGNRESFATLLFSRDSIVLWSLRTFWPTRRRYSAALEDPTFAHIHFIRFHHPRDAQRWLESQKISSDLNVMP